MESELGALCAEENFLLMLGDVAGVSELAYKSSNKEFSAPVLVSENALIFFPWTEEAIVRTC